MPSTIHDSCARGETNARVRGVVNGVVVLKELLADDKVHIGCNAATIVDPRVVEARSEAVIRARDR